MRFRIVNRIGLPVALLIGSTLTPFATAQKYAYPYGTEAMGIAGAVGADTLFAQPPNSRSADDIRTMLNPLNGTNVTKLVFYVSGYKSFLQAIDNDRNDVQKGSSPNSSGTTSIVSKGVAANLLSLATESGALARTDSKTVSTFRVNPTGIARLIAGDEIFPYCAIYDFACESGIARAMDSAAFSISFNTAPANAAQGSTPANTPADNSRVLSASTSQIAGWGARYDFHVRRKPADIAKNYGKQFNDTVVKAGVAYASAVNTMLSKIPLQALNNWEAKYIGMLQDDKTAERAEYIKALSDAVRELADLAEKADPQFKSTSDLVIARMSSYFVARDKVLSDYINKVTFSISYDNARPASQPSQSSARFILSARPTGLQLTANGTIEWYDHTLKASVNRVRDAQVAFQLDHTFGKTDAAVNPSLSTGYYFQYMADNALLILPSTVLAPGTTIPLPGNASELLNTKGSIHLGQVKITFKIRNSGISIPLALTFSNRTDLIKASEVRGNFGVTCDLDSLFAKR
jgi:hypothetical protein